MLNKIDNISAGSEFSKSTRPAGSGINAASAYNRRADVHDSMNISPALQFLNQVNWKLKEFKNINNEKISLDFIISNIEFITTIDLVSLNKLEMLDYNLLKEEKSISSNDKIYSQISSRIEEIRYNIEPSLINFSALNVFFSRAMEMRIYRDLAEGDSYIFNDLLNGITYGIRNEFEQLNNQVFIFIYKLLDIKKENMPNNIIDSNNSFTIKSLKVIHA